VIVSLYRAFLFALGEAFLSFPGEIFFFPASTFGIVNISPLRFEIV